MGKKSKIKKGERFSVPSDELYPMAADAIPYWVITVLLVVIVLMVLFGK